MLDVGSVLGDVGQMSGQSRGSVDRTVQGVHQRLVIREYRKGSGFQKVSDVPYGLIDGQ